MKLFILVLAIFNSLLLFIPEDVNVVREDFHEISSPFKAVEVGVNPDINKILNPNLISNLQFKPVKSTLLKKETKHWLRIIIDNKALAEPENYLYFNDLFAAVVLWQKDENGQWLQKSIGGYNIPYIKCEKGRLIDDKLLFQTSQKNTTELLIAVYQPAKDVILTNQFKIISKSEFDEKIRLIEDIQLMFAGIIFILCLFSLILFLFTHDLVYLMYFLYALFSELYFLSFFDIRIVSFFNATVNQYSFFSSTSSQVLYLWFIYFALKRGQIHLKLLLMKKYLIASSSVVGVIIIFSLFEGFQRGAMASDLFTATNGLFGIYVIFKWYNTVSKTLKIIFIGLFILLIGAAISFILNLIKPLDWHMFFYQIGFFVELILFTVAINYTYFVERNSRIQAMLDLSVLETQKLKTEKEALALQYKLDRKNRSLTSKAIELSKNSSFIAKVVDKLSEFEKLDTISRQDITRLKTKINSGLGQDHWKEFETYFTEVHPHFYNALNKKYPNLTSGEIRLCAFIKLNFSTKEIAAITGKTAASIDVSRSRLRKKMGLNTSENLSAIILSI